MEDAGLISSERRPVAEFLSAFATPAAGAKAARGVSHAVDHAIANFSPGPTGGARAAQLGVLSLASEKRLLSDLKSRRGSGTYRLGDFNEKQLSELQEFGIPQGTPRDVMMTDEKLRHLLKGRRDENNFSEEDIVRFVKQAMEPRAYGVQDPSMRGHKVALRQDGLRDKLTNQTYSAQMPLEVRDDGLLELVTVVPKGLWGRKKEAPK